MDEVSEISSNQKEHQDSGELVQEKPIRPDKKIVAIAKNLKALYAGDNHTRPEAPYFNNHEEDPTARERIGFLQNRGLDLSWTEPDNLKLWVDGGKKISGLDLRLPMDDESNLEQLVAVLRGEQVRKIRETRDLRMRKKKEEELAIQQEEISRKREAKAAVIREGRTIKEKAELEERMRLQQQEKEKKINDAKKSGEQHGEKLSELVYSDEGRAVTDARMDQLYRAAKNLLISEEVARERVLDVIDGYPQL